MLDAKRLLDQFLGDSGAGQSGEARRSSGMGFDLSRVGRLAQGAGVEGGLGRGMLAGGLAGLLLGSRGGRRLGGSALRLGGMALIGSLAYRAYQNWQAGRQLSDSAAQREITMSPPPDGTPFNPTDESEQQSLGQRLLRAMIAAAKADGTLGATEQANIFAEMDKLDLDADDKAFVMDELRAPLDIDAVANSARTPEEAAEIYTASLLAIDVDNSAERGYLGMLAARMKLDDQLVAHLHSTLEGAGEQPAGRS